METRITIAFCVFIECTSSFRFDVMDFLDDRLRQSNSAVVLATINVFLKYTIEIPDVHQRVYERIKEPLITHMSSPNAGVTKFFVFLDFYFTNISKKKSKL